MLKKALLFLSLTTVVTGAWSQAAVICSGQTCATEATLQQIRSGVSRVETELRTANGHLGEVKSSMSEIKTSVDGIKSSVDAMKEAGDKSQKDIRRIREATDRNSVGVNDEVDQLDDKGVVTESGKGKGPGKPSGNWDPNKGQTYKLEDFQDVPIDKRAAGDNAPEPGQGVPSAGTLEAAEDMLRSLYAAYRTTQGVYHRTMTLEQQFLHYQPQYGVELQKQIETLRKQKVESAPPDKKEEAAKASDVELHGVLAERNSIALHQAMTTGLQMLRANHHPGALESEEAFVQAVMERTTGATGQMQLLQMGNYLMGTIARSIQKARDLTAQQASSQIAWIQYSIAKDERERIQRYAKTVADQELVAKGEQKLIESVNRNKKCADDSSGEWLKTSRGEKLAHLPGRNGSLIKCTP